MYGIIAVLIICVFLIIFYKWCGNRKKLFYRILLLIGIAPFIYLLIISVISARDGFSFLFSEPEYGLQGFCSCFMLYCFVFFYIFIPAAIAGIVAIIKLIKLKKKSLDEGENDEKI